MTQTDSPIIELRHVDKHYGPLHVLRDISLRVHQGEVVVIVGPSGSGKSTLCRTINRLETIDSGEILIDGVALPEEGKKLAAIRSQVGMVFQSFNLFSHMTVLDNMILAPVGVLKKSKKEAREEAMRLLSDLRLGMALGALHDIDAGRINHLLWEIQPNCIMQDAGILKDAERDTRRAGILRTALKDTVRGNIEA